MKKRYWSLLPFVFAAVFILGLSSCESDDDESFSQADIVGVWDLVHEEGWEIYEGEKETWSMDLTNENCFEFYADGTGIEYDPSNRKDYDEFTYILSGNKLFIEDIEYGEQRSATIVTLNKSTLKLRYSWNDGSEKGEQTETYKRME